MKKPQARHYADLKSNMALKLYGSVYLRVNNDFNCVALITFNHISFRYLNINILFMWLFLWCFSDFVPQCKTKLGI